MLLNTNRKNDLRKFAQALLLVNYQTMVKLDHITLLEFTGNKVMVDYLLFKVNKAIYNFRHGKLKIDGFEG